jgi:DNA-binding phage protein
LTVVVGVGNDKKRKKECIYNLLLIKKLKNYYLSVDVPQQLVIIQGMIIEMLRKKIKNSGKSLNQIGKDTGVDKAALSRIMHGGSCKVKTVELLLKYFKIELMEKKETAKKSRAK